MIFALGGISMVLIAIIAAYWYACRYERRPASAPKAGPARPHERGWDLLRSRDALLRIFLCVWLIWAVLVAQWFSY